MDELRMQELLQDLRLVCMKHRRVLAATPGAVEALINLEDILKGRGNVHK